MPSHTHEIQLIIAKKKFDDAYFNSEVDYINGKIQTLEKEHICKQHHCVVFSG